MIQVAIHDDDRRYAVEVLKLQTLVTDLKVLMVIMKTIYRFNW